MYYQKTIEIVRQTIQEVAPGTRSEQGLALDPKDVPFSYLLWTCDKVSEMNTNSLDDALKASRWIGWILARAEVKGLWNNEISRDIVRNDVYHGFDRPHQQ